ncbi:MAG: hypothetical protein ACK456_01820 [Pseudanabaenaceae cyanobacterium]|jgi:hypothetical protein
MDNQPLSPEPPSEIVPESADCHSDVTLNLAAETNDLNPRDDSEDDGVSTAMAEAVSEEAVSENDTPGDPSLSPAISQVGLWWRWFLMTLFGVLLGTIAGIPVCLAGLYWLGELLTEQNLCHLVLLGGRSHLSCSIATAMLSGSVVMGLWLGLCQSWVLPRFFGHKILPQQYVAKYASRYGDVPLSTGGLKPYPRQRPYRRWWVLASVIGWSCIGLTATSLAYLPVLTAIIAPEGPSLDPSISQQLPSLTTGWGWLTGSGILLGMLQWLVFVFVTWRVPALGQSPWQRAVVWRSAWWVFLHGVLFGLTGLAIITIFRGRGGLLALLLFFIGFMPFYAGITGANLVKLKLSPRLSPKT